MNRALYRPLVMSVAAGISVLLPAAGLANQTERISVGPNVQVSASNASKPHTEVIIGADPLDSNHLVACGILWRAPDYTQGGDTVVYTSADAGAHWKQTFVVPGSGSDRSLQAADPYCLFGNHHRAYFFQHTLVETDTYPSERHPESQMINNLYASDDGGFTWHRIGGLPIADRPAVAIDRDHTSGPDIIFDAMFAQVNASPLQPDVVPGRPLVIYRSTDGGASFSTWQTYLNRDESVFGGIDVLPNGRAIAALSDQLPGQLGMPSQGLMRGSIDVVIPSAIATTSEGEPNLPIKVSDLDSCDQQSYPPYPDIAVDHGGGVFHGRAYVTWPDKRFGPCRSLLAYSDDGRSWSVPRIIDTDRYWGSAGDDFHPAVTVNKDGVVGVTWQDRQDAPSSLGWRKRFAASLDGGQTFLPSVAVSTGRLSVADNPRYPVYTLLSHGSSGAASRYKDSPVTLELELGGHPLTGGETTGLIADASGTPVIPNVAVRFNESIVRGGINYRFSL